MPTYEYVCKAGHGFEVFQKISDKPKSKCPECGEPATRKISGGAGLVFKGSGFYITDYGKDGKGPRKASDEGGSAKSDAKTEPKSGGGSAKSEPAAKPDAKPKGAKAAGE